MFIMIVHQTAIKQRFCRDTCTHTSGPGKWKVDLGDNYSVEKVWIRNRIDCCSERLDEVEVYFGHLQLILSDRYHIIIGEADTGIFCSIIQFHKMHPY